MGESAGRSVLILNSPRSGRDSLHNGDLYDAVLQTATPQDPL